MEGEYGRKDFPDEDILDIELGAWKMYFDGVVNQYGNGIGVLLTALEGSHIPLVVKLNFKATNSMQNMRLVSSEWKHFKSWWRKKQRSWEIQLWL